MTTPDQYYGSRLAYVVPITDDTRYRGCLAHGGYKKISKYFQSPEGTTKNCRSALKLCNYFFYINTHILSAGPCNISTIFTLWIRLLHSSTKITTFSANVMKTWILKDFWTLKTMAAFILACKLTESGKMTRKLPKSMFWGVFTPPSCPNGGGEVRSQ